MPRRIGRRQLHSDAHQSQTRLHLRFLDLRQFVDHADDRLGRLPDRLRFGIGRREQDRVRQQRRRRRRGQRLDKAHRRQLVLRPENGAVRGKERSDGGIDLQPEQRGGALRPGGRLRPLEQRHLDGGRRLDGRVPLPRPARRQPRQKTSRDRGRFRSTAPANKERGKRPRDSAISRPARRNPESILRNERATAGEGDVGGDGGRGGPVAAVSGRRSIRFVRRARDRPGSALHAFSPGSAPPPRQQGCGGSRGQRKEGRRCDVRAAAGAAQKPNERDKGRWGRCGRGDDENDGGGDGMHQGEGGETHDRAGHLRLAEIGRRWPATEISLGGHGAEGDP